MQQVFARQRVVTLKSMKEQFALLAKAAPRVPSDPSALQLRVRSYLADDALLLLDIFDAPVVSMSTGEMIAPRRSLPHTIPVASSLPAMVSGQKKMVLYRRWKRFVCTQAGSNWVLRADFGLRDRRHNNAHVKEYCANLFAEAPVTAACLQWNIQRVEAAQHPLEAGISLELAQRLELVPLGRTGRETFFFVFLDDDESGQRLRTLRANWSSVLNKPVTSADDEKQPSRKRKEHEPEHDLD